MPLQVRGQAPGALFQLRIGHHTIAEHGGGPGGCQSGLCCKGEVHAGIAREDEAVMRHIGGIEVDSEGPSLHLVELRVDEHPATLGRVPVLGNPVVFETAWVEICTEAAARTGGVGRDTLQAELEQITDFIATRSY